MVHNDDMLLIWWFCFIWWYDDDALLIWVHMMRFIWWCWWIHEWWCVWLVVVVYIIVVHHSFIGQLWSILIDLGCWSSDLVSIPLYGFGMSIICSGSKWESILWLGSLEGDGLVSIKWIGTTCMSIYPCIRSYVVLHGS